MDWEYIRVFLAVARMGQISRAARRLGVNHTTVGRQVSALEASLGVKLLKRGTTGCTLTDHGETLFRAAEAVDSELTKVSGQLSVGSSDIVGEVRVGAPDGLGNMFLASRLASLAAAHSGLVVQLVPLPRIFSLSRREADLAITLERPRRGKLIVRLLTEFTLHLYAASNYFEGRRRPRTIADLADSVLITNVDDLAYSRELEYDAALRKVITQRFECGSVVGQLESIASGHGIGVIHDYAARQRANLMRVLPEMRFRRSYWLVGHPDTYRTPRVAAVSDAITSFVRISRRAFLPDERGHASS